MASVEDRTRASIPVSQREFNVLCAAVVELGDRLQTLTEALASMLEPEVRASLAAIGSGEAYLLSRVKLLAEGRWGQDALDEFAAQLAADRKKTVGGFEFDAHPHDRPAREEFYRQLASAGLASRG